MNLDPFIFMQTHGFPLIFKFGFLALLVLFILFLIVVLKQVQSMNTIVTQPDLFPYVQGFVLFLISVTVALFVATLVIL